MHSLKIICSSKRWKPGLGYRGPATIEIKKNVFKTEFLERAIKLFMPHTSAGSSYLKLGRVSVGAPLIL